MVARCPPNPKKMESIEELRQMRSSYFSRETAESATNASTPSAATFAVQPSMERESKSDTEPVNQPLKSLPKSESADALRDVLTPPPLTHELLGTNETQKQVNTEEMMPGSFDDSGLRRRGVDHATPIGDAFPLEQDPTITRSDTAGTAGTTESQTEAKMCRICFAGEEEADLGRLISPCRCRGTMKYIHSGCLNAWRTASARSTSFFQCDQCGYKYRLERTRWARLVMNEAVLSLVTAILFTFLVFLSGFVCKLLIRFWILTDEDWVEMAKMDQMKREGKLVVLEDEWGSSMFSMDLRSLSLTRVDTAHFLAGLVLVGFFGAMSLMVTIFSGPFPRVGGVRIGGGYRPREGANSGTFLMAIFIIVGAVKTAYSLYKTVKSFSRRTLQVVETAILDVEPEAAAAT